MAISFFIDTIKFKSGGELKLQPNSIVVFVGANNAWKTTELNEIRSSAKPLVNNHQILDSIDITAGGTTQS
jgi:ABC-type branched-subunit amino acid transport system ATPase component